MISYKALLSCALGVMLMSSDMVMGMEGAEERISIDNVGVAKGVFASVYDKTLRAYNGGETLRNTMAKFHKKVTGKGDGAKSLVDLYTDEANPIAEKDIYLTALLEASCQNPVFFANGDFNLARVGDLTANNKENLVLKVGAVIGTFNKDEQFAQFSTALRKVKAAHDKLGGTDKTRAVTLFTAAKDMLVQQVGAGGVVGYTYDKLDKGRSQAIAGTDGITKTNDDNCQGYYKTFYDTVCDMKFEAVVSSPDNNLLMIGLLYFASLDVNATAVSCQNERLIAAKIAGKLLYDNELTGDEMTFAKAGYLFGLKVMFRNNYNQWRNQTAMNGKTVSDYIKDTGMDKRYMSLFISRVKGEIDPSVKEDFIAIDTAIKNGIGILREFSVNDVEVKIKAINTVPSGKVSGKDNTPKAEDEKDSKQPAKTAASTFQMPKATSEASRKALESKEAQANTSMPDSAKSLARAVVGDQKRKEAYLATTDRAQARAFMPNESMKITFDRAWPAK